MTANMDLALAAHSGVLRNFALAGFILEEESPALPHPPIPSISEAA